MKRNIALDPAFFLRLIRMLAALASAAPPLHADVLSAFDAGDEGWHMISFSDMSAGNYNVVSQYAATHNPAGGNPGGYISTGDPDTGDFTFAAPADFMASASAATALSYDLIHPTGAVNYHPVDVMLVSQDLRLVWKSSPDIVPGAEWLHVNVPLAPSSQWHLNNLSGAQPTAANFQSILSQLTGLIIEGEYTVGGESAGLDNVRLVGASAVTSADFNQDARVDGADFVVWQRGQGLASASRQQGDANNDAAVNAADLNIWRTQFGPTPVQSAPEPGAMALAALAFAAALVRRDRSTSSWVVS
jgi:MYXO-CTERM domain-containing protein